MFKKGTEKAERKKKKKTTQRKPRDCNFIEDSEGITAPSKFFIFEVSIALN